MFKAKFEHFKSEEFKYCGLLSENDFEQVKQCVINSGELTEEEIQMFIEKLLSNKNLFCKFEALKYFDYGYDDIRIRQRD